MDDAAYEIEAGELQRRLEAGEPIRLIDVREPDEYAICRLEGATLIPLGELGQRVSELDPDAEYVVYCKMGMRGARGAALLRQQGFSRVRNLRGGIMAWALTVDPSMPRY